MKEHEKIFMAFLTARPGEKPAVIVNGSPALLISRAYAGGSYSTARDKYWCEFADSQDRQTPVKDIRLK